VRKLTARLLSFLLVIAAIYLVMSRGGGVMSKAVETTRKVVAMWNLRSIKDVVLMSRILREPDTVMEWSDEDFADFLRENLSSYRKGGADPSLDPWDACYVMDPLETDVDWVVLSTGPNKGPDLCGFEGPGGDDICLMIEAAEISR